MNKQVYFRNDEYNIVLKACKDHGKFEKNGKIGVGALLVKLIKQEEARKDDGR